VIIGDGNGDYAGLNYASTQVVNEVYRDAIESIIVDPDNPNWVFVYLIIPPNVGGFTIREFSINDIDGDAIYVGNLADKVKPVLADGMSSQERYKFIIQVSNTATVNLTTDPNLIMATQQWVSDNFAGQGGGGAIDADTLGGKTESQLSVANAVTLNGKTESQFSEAMQQAVTIPTALSSPGLNDNAYIIAGKYHCNNPTAFDNYSVFTDVGAGGLNFPIDAVGLLEVIVHGTGSQTIYQHYTTRDTNQIFIRSRDHLLYWQAWSEISTPALATQAEAEAGTITTTKSWSPARIKQAIQALAGNNTYLELTIIDDLDTLSNEGRYYTSNNNNEASLARNYPEEAGGILLFNKAALNGWTQEYSVFFSGNKWSRGHTLSGGWSAWSLLNPGQVNNVGDIAGNTTDIKSWSASDVKESVLYNKNNIGDIRIIYSATNTAYPNGDEWLDCDGTVVTISAMGVSGLLYAEIQALLGGSGDSFTLPNIPDITTNVKYQIKVRI
jgi:hypothetical protein